MATGELMDRELDNEEQSQASPSDQAMVLATSRQSQEVQAAMIVARKFPRDEQKAIARITTACKRKGLSEASQYEYTRGGTMITGPSIRLAEVLAQCWGNLDFGVVELERRPGESVAMAYCWDLETNVRQTKVFTIRHVRDTRSGQKSLRDERDIYETVANNGARRLRNCILGIIPGDVQDLAIAECDKTLNGQNTEPIADRVRKMVAAFGEIGVRPEMIETKLNHKLDAVTPREIVKLGKLFTSIKDGIATVEEHFPANAQPANGTNGSATGKPSLDSLATELEGGNKPTKQPTLDEQFATFQAELLATTEVIPANEVRAKWFGKDSKIQWTDAHRNQADELCNQHQEALREGRGQRKK